MTLALATSRPFPAVASQNYRATLGSVGKSLIVFVTPSLIACRAEVPGARMAPASEDPQVAKEGGSLSDTRGIAQIFSVHHSRGAAIDLPANLVASQTGRPSALVSASPARPLALLSLEEEA